MLIITTYTNKKIILMKSIKINKYNAIALLIMLILNNISLYGSTHQSNYFHKINII